MEEKILFYILFHRKKKPYIKSVYILFIFNKHMEKKITKISVRKISIEIYLLNYKQVQR